MTRALSFALWIAVVGCGGKTAKTTPTGPSDPVTNTQPDADGGSTAVPATDGGNMSDTPSIPGSAAGFFRGAALTPKGNLIKWLDSQKSRLVRLPIILPMGQIGFDIAKARVGAGPDALEVYANDSSLGIGLADRARQACKGANPPTCAFWVEGYWQGEAMGSFELEVKKAEVLPADQVAAATFAEIQGENAK